MDKRSQYFWKNLLIYFLVVAIIVILIAGGTVEEPYRGFDFETGLMVTGLLSIIILGVKITLELTDRAYPEKEKKAG